MRMQSSLAAAVAGAATPIITNTAAVTAITPNLFTPCSFHDNSNVSAFIPLARKSRPEALLNWRSEFFVSRQHLVEDV
jgi:hypothetical protein